MVNRTKLINQNTGAQVQVGDAVITFRGEQGRVQAIHAPRHSASAGKVTVSFAGGAWSADYYPGVIGCRIVVTQEVK